MKIIGMIVVTLLGILFEGYTFATLWGWFVANTFNITTISIAQGMGLAMTVRFITNQTNLKKEKEMSLGESIASSVIGCVIVLLVGLILRSFI